MSFKEEVSGLLQTEIDSNAFIMDIVNRFKETIRQSIINPGIDSVVIMDIYPITVVPATETEPEHTIKAEPLTEQQIAQLQMACVNHVGVPVDVSPYQMVVQMIKFLQ